MSVKKNTQSHWCFKTYNTVKQNNTNTFLKACFLLLGQMFIYNGVLEVL